jgi:thymidylate synthase (FAD)
MDIVKSSYQIWNDFSQYGTSFMKYDGVALLRKIEHIARISHRSEDRITDESYDKFLRGVVLSKGDWSVVEHAGLTVVFYVDRGITHEMVRHRIASYTQESTRFVNYEKNMSPKFLYPKGCEETPDGVICEHDPDWMEAINACEEGYKKLIGKGWAPQIARSVLPNGLGSKIAMTCNLRNWRHFLLMRTTRETHPQMKEVTIPLLAEMKNKIPIVYEDIEPEATQADNLKKMR